MILPRVDPTAVAISIDDCGAGGIRVGRNSGERGKKQGDWNRSRSVAWLRAISEPRLNLMAHLSFNVMSRSTERNCTQDPINISLLPSYVGLAALHQFYCAAV